MRTITKISFLAGFIGFLFSCKDNYMPAIFPFFASVLIYIKYRITAMDNEILRSEKDAGRELLTEIYEKNNF